MHASEYGYDGIAFRGLNREFDLPKCPEFSKEGRQETRHKMEAAKLETSMILASTRVTLTDPAELEDSLRLAESHIDLASDLHCPYVRVFGGPILSGLSHDAAVQRVAERLRRLGDYAKSRGVEVLIETHDDWTVTARLKRVMEILEHPNVGVLWDVHHPFRVVNEGIAESWKNIGKWTRSVDFKDSITDPEARLGYRYVPIGDGEAPLGEAMSILKGVKYDGWLTFEWEKYWHPDIVEPTDAFPAFVKTVRRMIG
ncbi:sugar phosphate isomerase/epimerase [Paraburkholderia sp. RL17-337-BIB-A]